MQRQCATTSRQWGGCTALVLYSALYTRSSERLWAFAVRFCERDREHHGSRTPMRRGGNTIDPVVHGPWRARGQRSRAKVSAPVLCSLDPPDMEEGLEESEGRLLAALARFPVFTKHKGRRHPKIRFRKVDAMFHWDKIAAETGLTEEEAIRRAFGPEGKSFQFLRQRTNLKSNLPKVGILVQNEIVTEEEENAILAYLRRRDMVWQPREFHGLRANFGPTLTPQYTLHRSYRLTKIPQMLQSMRSKVLDFIRSSEDLRRFAMTPYARRGQVEQSDGHCFNQALLQRYQGGVHPEDPSSQALPMHLDQRDLWAEVVAAVSLGSPGHVFFSSSKPGTLLTYTDMRRLVRRHEGILVQLPPRSMYAFFGLARYALCHGVAGLGDLPSGDTFDRITVTWRSVKPPRAPTADPPCLVPPPGPSSEDVGLWGQHG